MACGFQAVTDFGILAALRTAAASAVVAKRLASKGSKVMGVIDNDAQCEFHALAFKAVMSIDTIQLYDIDSTKTELHKDILLRSEVFVEYPPQARMDGEIQ